ncbi:DUF2254 domain-containing protein [Streptomyces mexicanus]
MITLAGFVVTAITLVVQTVQATSPPRLVSALGHFSRYLILFGLLIGTALYALVALSHVRGPSVPRLSVTLAVGLVLIDAVAVLYLLATLRHAVTGGGLARAVGARLRTVIDETSPAATAEPPVPGASRRPDEEVTVVHDGRPAVVHAVDERRLTRLAARHDIRVRLLQPPGAFVGTHAEIARLECSGTGAAPPRLVRQVASCVRYGPSRTLRQDTAYGFRLLADIAIRALSPAVNDPTTAVQTLDQIEEALLRLADRPLGPVWLLDTAGLPRVARPAPDWHDLLSTALDETLLYGTGHPQVVRRLRALLDRLLTTVPEERGAPVLERRDALEHLTAAALPDPLFGDLARRPDP